MRSSIFLAAATAITLGAAYTEPPPTTADPRTIQNCTSWVVAGNTDSCASIATAYNITIDQFDTYNPSVGASCNLTVGNSYCVQQKLRASRTEAVEGVSTPSPIQPGMVTNCDEFYSVKPGDYCDAIVSSYGISLANFYAWNPAVGSTCQNLQPSTYVCVHVTSGGSTPTPTSSSNGVATPTPIQSGMCSNCTKFYFVEPNDNCGTVAAEAGITLATFYAWNPAVGNTCASLLAGYYVCIAT